MEAKKKRPIRGRNSTTFKYAAGGAGLGAVIGAFILPGFGAALGGAIGGGLGGVLGSKADDRNGR